eukprot:scaffold48195_cov24-Attheya_sp.AAC.1
MGLFDGFRAGGSGIDRLDEEYATLEAYTSCWLTRRWEKQQEILKLRRASSSDREKYFTNIEERRSQATKEQNDNWAWQTKTYKKGEDPIDEWKKRRAS